MTPPGWYPDPSGDWSQRYWDGDRWTDHVANGSFQASDPISEDLSVAENEVVLWQQDGSQLSNHRVWIDDDYTSSDPAEFALWMLEPSLIAVDGSTITVVVRYPGYVSRASWNITGVANADEVAAAIRKYANRNRRKSGLA